MCKFLLDISYSGNMAMGWHCFSFLKKICLFWILNSAWHREDAQEAYEELIC